MNPTDLKQRSASKEAISHHYDLSNSFYARWLDPTMTYTCALWDENNPHEGLKRAQLRKIDWYAQQIQAAGAERVLDVGCGWGGALHRMIQEWGVKRGVGLTLSTEQKQACEALEEPQLEAKLENWIDYTPDELYDAIISIEAIEAFARPDQSRAEKVEVYRSFYERCHSWLKPGGFLAIQAITYGNATPEDLDDFIKETIFPESDLPRLAELLHAAERLFEPVLLVNHREHYIRTLREWNRNLRASREATIAEVGKQTFRDYDLYLRFSQTTFKRGANDLLRMIFRRIDNPRSPPA